MQFKAVVSLASLILLAGLSVAQPQVKAVEDNQGNYFNFTIQQNSNGTITYGTGSQRNARVTDRVEIENNTDLEICVEEKTGNLSYSAWLGATSGNHPANIPVKEKIQENCFSWNINESFVKDNRLRVNIWSRNQDRKFQHYNKSESDLYIGIKYENVTVVERTEESGILDGIKDFLLSIL